MPELPGQLHYLAAVVGVVDHVISKVPDRIMG